MLTVPSRTYSVAFRLVCSAVWSFFAWLGVLSTEGLVKSLLTLSIGTFAAIGVLSTRIGLEWIDEQTLVVKGLFRRQSVRIQEVVSVSDAVPNPLLSLALFSTLKLSLRSGRSVYLPSILFPGGALPPDEVQYFIDALSSKGVSVSGLCR